MEARTRPQAVAYNIIGSGQNSHSHAYETCVSGCLQHKGLAASGNEAGTLAVAYRTSGNSGVTEQGDRTAALNCATDPTQNIVTTHALTRRHDSSEDGCGRGTPPVPDRLGVRRLTPREYERLQGLPDDWTRHGASGKEISDSRRYQMIGNAGAVPVLEWIGRRVAENPSESSSNP